MYLKQKVVNKSGSHLAYVQLVETAFTSTGNH